MAVSAINWKKKTDELDNFDIGLIERDQLQQLQDFFCRSNCVYLTCLGKEEGVITKSYGSREELAFIHELVGKDAYMSLVSRMKLNIVEHMVEQPLSKPYVKMCGISTQLEDKTQVIWVVIALLKEYLPEDLELPEEMLVTTEMGYLRSIEFLEVLSRQLFAVKIDELIAEEARKRSQESEEKMEYQLRRSEAMTQVVCMLDSERGFDATVKDILMEVCSCLDIFGGFLIREGLDGVSVEPICEYVRDEARAVSDTLSKMDKRFLPFFNGKTYLVSSDSMMPDNFKTFFTEFHFRAAMFLPVEINESDLMYLGFYEMEKERIWEQEDIKFINDVKRIVQSILLKRIAKNSLASSYASLEAILENVGCGICVTDELRRQILYTNNRFGELFSQAIAENRLETMLFSKELSGEGLNYEEMYFPEEERWLDINKTSIKWVDGREVSLRTIYDITDRKLYQRKIENQANNDFLTGLFNRMRCEQDLQRYILKAEASGGEGALLYVDLDDFKQINDVLGHQYGDVLLKAISHSIQKIPGIEETCYRMGGDEFIVIVSDENFAKVQQICNDIQFIFTRPWSLKGEEYYCTMSMGIACFPSDGNTVEDLIRKADLAMFAAKRKGKNRVEFYTDKEDASSHRRLDLEKNMRAATMNECREFEVFYQPIVDISKPGQPCCGAEALVRWNSTAMGFVKPNDFIPLAEYLGLINPIGEFVLMEAAKRCRYWNDMGHPEYRVNVNLSVVQLLQNDIVKQIKRVLTETRVDPRNLTLEVTESLAINDMERMKQILGEIRELGVRVALDDFGTGYSSLNHIREMPIDVIKIDRCFIENLGEDDFSNSFVKVVAELANTIGVTVCVEGVETKQQLDEVEKMQIRLVQGFYINKPMTIEEFERYYL